MSVTRPENAILESGQSVKRQICRGVWSGSYEYPGTGQDYLWEMVMDEKIARAISRLPDFERLKIFERNARDRNLLTPEIAVALDDRAVDLGRELVAKGTDLDLSDLSIAEEKIVRAASEYAAIKRRGGTNAGRTITALRKHGLIEAAERAVMHSHATPGYEMLENEDLGDLSYEQIIIDHPEEFSSRALWYARRRKGLPNESEKAPVKAVTAAQRRNVALLYWMRDRAASLSGKLGEFTNAEAAAAIGMTNMQDQGRVFGNIISRIDFACFRLGLPPLGLTADEPFRNAWGQGERTWRFPVQSMQQAAKEFTWKGQDFDRVLAQTEGFPGLAHFLWKDALAREATAVRDWAEGLVGGPRESDATAEAQTNSESVTRNPDWSREEHILGLDLYIRLCEAITQPPAPFHVTPRGFAGPNLLAMVLFEKFGQHQPLNRQSERYAREGVELSLSTLAD